MEHDNTSPEKAFWEWFLLNSDKLFFFELYQDTLLPEALEQLQKVNTDLVFEISPEIEGKRDFIISANGIKEAFPAVFELTRAAPQLDIWNVIPFRQRKEITGMEIEIDDVALAPEDVLFDYDYTDNKVDLSVYIEDFDEEDERLYHIVFILLDNIIGEYDVEMKIGQIDMYPLDQHANPEKLRPLNELPRIVDNLNHKIVH